MEVELIEEVQLLMAMFPDELKIVKSSSTSATLELELSPKTAGNETKNFIKCALLITLDDQVILD